MSKTIYIVNGPNLSHLKDREEKFYHKLSLSDIENHIYDYLKKMNSKDIFVKFFQSNSEGEIISFLLDNLNYYQGLIINPAAYSHYSIAISDTLAILKLKGKIICEVHISNIFARDEERQRLVTAKNSDLLIAGGGLYSYSLALEYIVEKLSF